MRDTLTGFYMIIGLFFIALSAGVMIHSCAEANRCSPATEGSTFVDYTQGYDKGKRMQCECSQREERLVCRWTVLVEAKP